MDVSTLLEAFASAFSQDNRLITLDLGDARRQDGQLLPQRVDGNEAVSACYRCPLHAVKTGMFAKPQT